MLELTLLTSYILFFSTFSEEKRVRSVSSNTIFMYFIVIFNRGWCLPLSMTYGITQNKFLSPGAFESWSCEGLPKASEWLLKAFLKPLHAFEGMSEAFEMPLRACLKPLRASRWPLSYL